MGPRGRGEAASESGAPTPLRAWASRTLGSCLIGMSARNHTGHGPRPRPRRTEMRLVGRRLAIHLRVLCLIILAVLVSAGLGEAQTLTFRFAPGCAKVTLTLVPTGSPS